MRLGTKEDDDAQLHEGIANLLSRPQALSGRGASHAEARTLIGGYSRALHDCRAGVGGNAFTEFVLSPEAGDDSEDLDMRFMLLAKVEIDAAIHAVGAVREVTREP